MTGYAGYYTGNTGAMNSWERKKLGYINYLEATYDGITETLRDYVTTGDVLRITIPFNDTTSIDYYLIENHQRVSMWDYIIRGGSIGGSQYPNYSVGKGIYIWKVQRNDYPPFIEAVTADGGFDWQYAGDFWASGFYVGESYEGWVPKTIRTNVKRYYGKSDRDPHHIYWNSHWASKWCDINPLTNHWELTRDVLGDETDAYNMGFNELLTPWSNPSTTNDPQQPANISLELVLQNGNDITVRAYSETASGLALPPSKPQNLKVSITLDSHPKLTWDDNLEPDVTEYKIYRSTNPDNGFIHIGTVAFSSPINTSSYIDYTITVPGPKEPQGTIYYYRAGAKDNTNKESVMSDFVSAVSDQFNKSNQKDLEEYEPVIFKLATNYPNPFNPATVIDYEVANESIVQLKIFDILGKEVAELVNETKLPGTYQVNFNADNLSSGVYIYRITASNNGRILFADSNKLQSASHL